MRLDSFMEFNPFESRLCRDIRNSLGSAFVLSLKTGDPGPLLSAADGWLNDRLPKPARDYIEHRKDCLGKVFEQMRLFSLSPQDDVPVSILLWNLQLFFEFHEWMEIKWNNAQGENKKALQILILLSVAHEHQSYGRQGPAKKAAQKALLLLPEFGGDLLPGFDKDRVAEALNSPEPDRTKFCLKA